MVQALSDVKLSSFCGKCGSVPPPYIFPSPFPCQGHFSVTRALQAQLTSSPSKGIELNGAHQEVSTTVVKKTKDAALEHVKKALRNGGSLLTRPEASFIRTSCHILGLNGEATVRAIVKRAKNNEGHQPRKVLDHLQSQLIELADRVDKQKRPTPNPASSTRAVDAMGAPVHSLANLQSCADALRDSTSKGSRQPGKQWETQNQISRLLSTG